jgi:hypothetical protein
MSVKPSPTAPAGPGAGTPETGVRPPVLTAPAPPLRPFLALSFALLARELENLCMYQKI